MQGCRYTTLHALVTGPLPSLWTHPVNVLARVFDVTGLAVDTVLRVDLKPFSSTVHLHELVHTWDIEGCILLVGEYVAKAI